MGLYFFFNHVEEKVYGYKIRRKVKSVTVKVRHGEKKRKEKIFGTNFLDSPQNRNFCNTCINVF